MLDNFNRNINYLRISVTDRCNLRCVYCMPAEGIKLLKHEDILRYTEISEVVQEAVKLGVNKVRITGGEPLVRKNIVQLVKMLSEVKGIHDLSMTTNAILLGRYADQLYKAGLMRVNVSLDTLNAEKYRKITRCGDLNKAINGIFAAKKAGLNPIKINCVVENHSNEKDAQEVKAFCAKYDFECRFIRKMDLNRGKFWKVEGGEGGDCSICNRLRLTSDGYVKPCLFDDKSFNVRELGARKAILMALENKPKCGTLNQIDQFHNIGG